MIKRSSKASIATNYSDTSNEEQNDEDHYYEWHSKFSPKDLQPFCEQLGKFVKYIHSVQELSSLTYGYPRSHFSGTETSGGDFMRLNKKLSSDGISKFIMRHIVEPHKISSRCLHSRETRSGTTKFQPVNITLKMPSSGGEMHWRKLSALQQRLEADANELQSLYLEVKAAVTDIERIKQQRKCIHKEINATKKVLKKLREEEVREMETTVSAYDKPMYTRWENLKNTSKPQILQVFLNDIKVKQEALEHLSTLVSRKLEQVTPLSMPWIGGINNTQTNKDAKDVKEEKRKLNTRNSFNRYHNGTSGIPRWTFGRGNTSQPVRSVGFTQQQNNNNNNPLPLVPFTMNNSPFQFMNRDANESLAAIEESNSIHLFRETSNFAVNSLNSTENNNTLNIPANATATNENQGDMSSVLHALFGQLQQNPSTPASANDTDAETNNDRNESIDDEGIELFRHF